MNSRRKESIKVILLFMASIIAFTSAIIFAVGKPKCNCYEIQAKEYDK